MDLALLLAGALVAALAAADLAVGLAAAEEAVFEAVLAAGLEAVLAAALLPVVLFAVLLAVLLVFVAAADLFFAGLFASEGTESALAALLAVGLPSEASSEPFDPAAFACALTFSSFGFNALGTGIGM